MDLIEAALQAVAAEPFDSDYNRIRRERYPYLRTPPAPSYIELAVREESLVELPSLAWTTTVAHALSIFEALLGGAVDEAAACWQLASPPQLGRGAVIEARFAQLAMCRAVVRAPSDVVAELRGLRRIRNSYVHALRIDRSKVPPLLRVDFECSDDGALIPTARLARRALRTVESAIASVDTALMVMKMRSHQSGMPDDVVCVLSPH